MTEPSHYLPVPKDAAKPRAPVAGFVIRISAMAIDWVLIYFAGYTLEMSLRGPLLKLGPLWPFLATVGVMIYFWLGNGPVGRGATLGKSVLNLHVVTAEGKPLDYGASFRRALIQFPMIYTATFNLFREGLGFPHALSLYGGQFFSIISVVIILTQGFSLLTHPLRQGLHDMWAGSFVTPDPFPATFKEMLTEGAAEHGRIRLASQKRMTAVFVLAMALLFFSQWTFGLFDRRTQLEGAFADLVAGRAPIPGYRLEQAVIPSAESLERFNQGVARVLMSQLGRSDSDTTDTLRNDYPDDGETIFFQYLKNYGEITPDELKDSELRNRVEILRRESAKAYADLHLTADPKRPAPRRIFAGFADPFRFLFFPVSKSHLHLWRLSGPLDPSAGEIEYKWIQVEPEGKARTGSAEEKTTGTLPQAR